MLMYEFASNMITDEFKGSPKTERVHGDFFVEIRNTNLVSEAKCSFVTYVLASAIPTQILTLKSLPPQHYLRKFVK